MQSATLASSPEPESNKILFTPLGYTSNNPYNINFYRKLYSKPYLGFKFQKSLAQTLHIDVRKHSYLTKNFNSSQVFLKILGLDSATSLNQ